MCVPFYKYVNYILQYTSWNIGCHLQEDVFYGVYVLQNKQHNECITEH